LGDDEKYDMYLETYEESIKVFSGIDSSFYNSIRELLADNSVKFVISDYSGVLYTDNLVYFLDLENNTIQNYTDTFGFQSSCKHIPLSLRNGTKYIVSKCVSYSYYEVREARAGGYVYNESGFAQLFALTSNDDYAITSFEDGKNTYIAHVSTDENHNFVIKCFDFKDLRLVNCGTKTHPQCDKTAPYIYLSASLSSNINALCGKLACFHAALTITGVTYNISIEILPPSPPPPSLPLPLPPSPLPQCSTGTTQCKDTECEFCEDGIWYKLSGRSCSEGC
jgi:hypothetical protein